MLSLFLNKHVLAASLLICLGAGPAVLQAQAAPARAAQSPATVQPAAGSDSEVSEVFSRQRMALSLIRYADRRKDGMALLQAVRIQDTLQTRTVDGSPLSRIALLQRARVYAAGQPELLALIKDAEEANNRGTPQGPLLQRYLAPVNEMQKLVIRFAGGAKAVVSFDTEDSQTLQFEVLDATGRSVCRRPRGTQECVWTPSETADYQVQIRNVGASSSEYSLFHN